MVNSISEKNFNTEVLAAKGLVVVDFNADWCGPCQMLAPILAELSTEEPKVKFVAVNVDQNRDLAQQYDVMSIPCVVFFKNGQEMERQLGFLPKSVFQEIINRLK